MHDSLWHIQNSREYPTLDQNISVDIVIIGGGLAGILSAYLLTKSGKRVALLESDRVGSGATAYTTAFITHVIDTNLRELIKLFGRRRAEHVWQSGKEALDHIEKIVNEEKIDCDFMRVPFYIYAATERNFRDLEREARAAKKIGFETFVKRDELLPFEHRGYWEIPEQAKFHPLKFLHALAKRAEEMGAQIFEKSEVQELTREKGITAFTREACVQAHHAIIATYFPFNNPRQTSFKKGMYKSYVLETTIPKKILPEALYADMKNPYHYFRVDVQKNSDRIIVGGEDHRIELPVNAEKSFEALQAYLAALLPNIHCPIAHRWEGPILEPSDGLPLIGEYAPKQFIATAFSGNGMTYSMIASLMLQDMILGKRTEWARTYHPKRIPTLYQLFQKGKNYTGEFFGGAVRNTFRSKKF